MADEEIRPEVYYIPENFDDAGGVLGGLLNPECNRNGCAMWPFGDSGIQSFF